MFDGRSDGFEDHSAFLGGPNFAHGMQSNSHGMESPYQAAHDTTMALTAKQAVFCREYLIDLNATQAAVRAGYSPNTAAEMGYENLRKPQIVEKVVQLQSERSTRTEITADWVLSKLRENVCRAMTAEPVLDTDGNPTGEYRYDGSVANRALELLGKQLGLFRDRLELTGLNGGPVAVEEIVVRTRAEAAAIAAAVSPSN